ncbi:MAG: tRNA lysidine(34) synthetase TilS [Gammaproteobacteria bacterium]
MSFDLQHLRDQLGSVPGTTRFRVALSGGVDSSVLLCALADLRERGEIPLACDAIHVHHGLSPNADRWSHHCRALCERAGFPFQEVRVTIDPEDPGGLEAAARHARYRVLEERMSPGTCLLLAHHADDQAETLLLQLMRGSGPQGLSAMPRQRPFGSGQLLRPLLDFRRAEIVAWAKQRGIEWIEDESNRSPDRDRNFLRLEILPRLQQRWPAAALTLSRSARLCAEASELGRELAIIDRKPTRSASPKRLRWSAAAGLSHARRKNLLRHWIRENGFPLPNADRLEEMAVVFWSAGGDRQPLVRWQDTEVRRYRDQLYIGGSLPPPPTTPVVAWDGRTPVEIEGAGRLESEVTVGGDRPALSLPGGGVEIRFRRGGERCRIAGSVGSRPLKKILQELAVEPWLRDRIPLVYCGDRLAAIADRAVCEGFLSEPGSEGIRLIWHPPGE